MKVSLNWLREYIPVTMGLQELSDKLTMTGLEVDSIENRYESLDQVVVSRIIETKPHPNADKLTLCTVDVGGNQVIPIVCGAPNAAKDLVIPCALPGATLPNGIQIKKGKLRGEVSEGMLCSASELGLSLEKSGIMELSTDAAPGTPLVNALNLDDATLDVSITPNRSDCLSMIGIAREIGAFSTPAAKITRPEPNLASTAGKYNTAETYTSVQILDPELCPRYAARLIFDVTVGPSPFWLQDRLLSIGLKPINNIVDITNYVMMETGQPLHAFDFDRLVQNRIVVRAAKNGETFTTLDNKDHVLDNEMLMICDGEKPVAIGGVMGGLNSEIEDTTTRVLLESAYFNPASIRKTSKKTGLSTDAAYRFERGTDPEGVIYAMNRAAALIAELGKGNLVEGIIDEYPLPVPARTITMSVKALNKRLGTSLSKEDIKGYLESVELTVTDAGDDTLTVIPPTFRVDIERPEDLSEEVARLWGYSRIQTTFPQIPAEAFDLTPNIKLKNQVRTVLTGLGFNEAINYSFIHAKATEYLRLPEKDPRRDLIGILNPLSEDQSVMRTSLVPSLLQNIQHNNARQVKNVMLFEIGKEFRTSPENILSDEVEILAGVMSGNRLDQAWYSKEVACDFYDLKGYVESFLDALYVRDIRFTQLPEDECLYMKKGYSARIYSGETVLGTIGKIHPEVLDRFDIRQDVFIFEISLKNLVAIVTDDRCASPIPRYPSVSRDTTIICGNSVQAGIILEAIRNSGEHLVEHAELIDLYTGNPIPDGKKSLSFRMTYRDPEKTLKDKDVNRIHTKITQMILDRFGAALQG